MLDAVREKMRAGSTRVVLGAATGAGKTACAAEIMRSANAKGNRTLFLADRRALIEQTREKLAQWGVVSEPWFGGAKGDGDCINIVATYQTWERAKPPGDFQLVVVDECHVRVGYGETTKPQSAKAVLDHYQAPAVGLTATPFHKRMGDVWDGLVYPETTDSLIQNGHLVRPRIWSPSPINVDGLRPKSNGEWGEGDLHERMLLVAADIVGEYVKRVASEFNGEPPRTLVFAPSAASCAELARELSVATGRPFVSISYLESATNDANVSQFRAGEVVGLVSRDMVGRGFDVPDVRFVILARPFRKAVGEVIQQVGRGMRTAEGKSTCIVHDHAGNFRRLGDLIDCFWKDGVSKFDRPCGKPGPPPTKTCPNCSAEVPQFASKCPECGCEFKARPPILVEREFEEWVRNTKNEAELSELATNLCDGMGIRRFCSHLMYARMQNAPNALSAAKQTAAMLFDWTGHRRTAAWCSKLEPSKENRVAALAKRSYALWAARRAYKRRFGAGSGGRESNSSHIGV